MTDDPPRKHSTPNPDRPRLPDELEEKLFPLDQRSAEGYTKIEEALDKVDRALAEGVVEALMDATDTSVHRVARAAAPPKREP